MLIIDWLLTKDEEVIKRNKETITERLWLKDFEKFRHKKRINSTLEEGFLTAKGLGYLADYSFQENINELTFVLNPEKCRRIKANKNGKKKDAQEKKVVEVHLIDPA